MAISVAGPLQWELVDSEEWPTTSSGSGVPAWTLVEPGKEYSDTQISRDLEAEETRQAQAEELMQAAVMPERPRNWIVGAGGGARIGIGEPTYPMVYGRLGHWLSDDLALSLRPSYVFGNSDSEGKRNNQGAFQMPLTLDLAPDALLSPFFGLGIATNTDSNGKTEPMASLGVDLNITRNLSIAAAINVIYQRDDDDRRDVEALTVLYLRF
jgi:hypothetical protein